MTERGHREVDHTADVAFEVWGAGLGALFAEATLALCELCYERDDVRQRQERTLAVGGQDREELLVHWLQEVYLQVEMEGWLTAAIVELEVGEDRVSGVLAGESIDRDRHTLHTEIKAITYHGLEVERRDDETWRATVIVDV